MTGHDIRRLNGIAGVLGNALREVEGLIARYDGQPAPPPKRRRLRAERQQEYRYRLLSGRMTRNGRP